VGNRAPPVIDRVDALALADYGPPPHGWFDAVLYVLRVRQRRSALAGALAGRRKQLAEAEEACHAELARTIDSVRSKAGPAHPIGALLEPLQTYDETLAGRQGALAETSRRLSDEVSALDARVASLEAERAKAQALAGEAQAALDVRAEEHARTDAKVKRIDIELRAAHEAARIAAGPGAKYAPPEHARKIADLDADRSARVADLAPLVQAYDEAHAIVQERRAAVRALKTQISALGDEKHKLLQAGSRQIDVRSQGTLEAERARLAAYAEVAREVILRHPGDVPVELRTSVAAAEERLRGLAVEVETHALALRVADPSAMRRGLIVLGLAALFVVLLLAMVIRTAAQ
jgi:hypothetical protein